MWNLSHIELAHGPLLDYFGAHRILGVVATTTWALVGLRVNPHHGYKLFVDTASLFTAPVRSTHAKQCWPWLPQSHVLGPMAMLCKLVQVHIWAHNLWSRWSIPHWGQHKWLASLSMWPCYGRFQLYLEFWPLDLIILISSCYNLHVMQKIILSYRNGI